MAGEKIKAAVAVRARETEVRSFSLPEIPADAGLLRVMATGVCGSDWPLYSDGETGPRILGHEMVGRIEKLGDLAADRWGVEVGDVVALEEYLPCGHCHFCRSGEIRSCLATDSRLPGSIRYGVTPISVEPSLWGGYSEFLFMHPRTVLHRVPEGVPPHIAAMAVPIGNGFQWAYLDGGAGPGKAVVVQGPGQQGLACVAAAKAAGASTVIATGLKRDEHRLEVARALGADVTVCVDEEDLLSTVARATDGRMADLVIDATSAGAAILNASVKLLQKRGTLIVSARKPTHGEPFDLNEVVNKQIIVRGTRGHSFQSVELALQLMASKRAPLELMSTHHVGLTQVDDAIRMVGGQSAEKAIHVTVDPWL